MLEVAIAYQDSRVREGIVRWAFQTGAHSRRAVVAEVIDDRLLDGNVSPGTRPPNTHRQEL